MNVKIKMGRVKQWPCVALACLVAGGALGGVVAVNDEVPWPQLVVPEGTAADPGVGDLVGYTVWKAAEAPKPKVTLLLLCRASSNWMSKS